MSATEEPKNRRVLVIDDNKAIHGDFAKILTSGGEASALEQTEAFLFGESIGENAGIEPFELDSAYQGQEGFEKVVNARREGRPYAMAFVDVRMPPGWDGIETVSHMWVEDRDIQVVICTAYSDYSWEAMIGKLGPSDRLLILKKPFDTIEVRQMAEALTAKWALARRIQTRIEGLESELASRGAEIVMG